jgi:hypothetical protein
MLDADVPVVRTVANEERRVMADLVVVVGVLAFFAIAALFVAACDRIVGSDEEAEVALTPDAAREEVAAMTAGAR